MNAKSSRNRVGHREERDVKGAKLYLRAISNLTKLSAHNLVLSKLTLNKAKRELAGIDWHLTSKIHKQVRKSTNVILMTVSNQNTAKLIFIF